MRVAYCLSGLMRTYEETYESQRTNIIEPNDCDVFLTTWDVAGNAKHNLHQAAQFQREVDESKIRSLYGDRLKAITIFDFNKTQPELPNFFYKGMVSMFWQIKQCDLLRRKYEQEQGFQYDVVIRSRPDIYFSSGLKIQDVKSLGPFLWVRGCDGNNMNDMFAFGNNRVMTHYSDMFDSLGEYDRMKDLYKPDGESGIICWPEHTLLFYIKRSQIPIASFPIQFNAHRGNYKFE